MDAEIIIRPFQQADREPLLEIAADTAFFGEPVENFMEDRRIFLDAFYVYYTDQEPGHCWVAAYGDEVVGFLTGCFDTEVQRTYTARVLDPQTFKRLVTGKYRVGRKFILYLYQYYLSRLKSSKNPIDLLEYPAHFHINIIKEWRGMGIGGKLIECFLNQLRDAQIGGVHLQTTSYNRSALILYQKMGFQMLNSTRSYLWERLVNEPIHELIYGMRLG